MPPADTVLENPVSFTSVTFIIFFAGLFAVYWLLRRSRWQNLFLLAASFFFYAWVSPWYAVLLAATTAADFYLALGMVRWQNRRKTFLVFSLIMNLGMLGFFKYFNFFSASAAAVLQGIGLAVEPAVVSLALPLGISFYTLKKLSYILDVHSGVMQPVRSLVDYELYVAFFPQVISGPIDRPRQLLPQIQAERRWLPGHFNAAWPLLVMGLFKKLVVADTIKIMVDKIFILTLPGKLLLLCGGLAFTLQVLADFSAYTDISRGLAYLLGFKTSENFRRPYLSLTPTDFWNRWHITLSSWLRDYIFFPLRRALLGRGFASGSAAALILPPILTMLASGLWHGAGWTYILWGLYYGVLIVAYQLLGMGGAWKPKSRLHWLLAWAVMFTWIVLGWILFRSPSVAWLVNDLIHAPLLTFPGEAVAVVVVMTSVIFYSLLMLLPGLLELLPERWRWLESLYLAAALVMVVIYINSTSPDFIYFQF